LQNGKSFARKTQYQKINKLIAQLGSKDSFVAKLGLLKE